MHLNDITDKKYYKVKNINNDKISRRLNDIGLISDSKIKLLYVSPSKTIKGYLIKDSVIAIRDSDAIYIEVYDD